MAFNKSENQALTGTGLANVGRPAPANQGFEELFSGAARALQNTVSAYDEGIRTQIEIDADKAVNEVLAGDTGGEVEIPAQVKASADEMAKLKMAKDQGVISDIEYKTGLARKAKALRSSIPPGYGPIAEKAIAAASGASTANDLRTEQLAMISKAEDEADMSNKERRMFLNTNSEWLTVPNVEQTYKAETGRALKDDISAGTWDMDTVRYAIGREQADKYSREQEEAAIRLGKAKAGPAARRAADAISSDVFNEKAGPFSDFLKMATLAETEAGDGGSDITPQEGEQMLKFMNDFETSGMTKINQMLTKFPEMEPSERDAIQADFKEKVTLYRDLLISKDYGTLYRLKREAERRTDLTNARLLRNGRISRQIKAAKENGLPEAYIKDVLLKNGAKQDELLRELEEAASWEILTNGDVSAADVLQEGVDDAKDKGKDPGVFVSTVVKNLQQILNNPNIKEEDLPKIASQVFRDGNNNLLARLAKDSKGRGNKDNQLAAFRGLVTPKVVQGLRNDPDAMQNLHDWATAQFDTLSKTARDTLVDQQLNNYDVEFSWDGKQFAANPRGRTWAQVFALTPPAVADFNRLEAIKQMGVMNQYVQTMMPIWESMNISPEQAMSTMFPVNLQNLPKNPTILQSLGNALGNAIAGDDGMAGKNTMEKAKKNLPGKSLIDFSRGVQTPEDTATPVEGTVVDRTADMDPRWSKFGDLTSVDGFVIHHTGGRGGVDGVIQTFKERGYPAQYVIDRQGRIFQTLPDGKQGRQIKNSGDGLLSNKNTIGVEVIAKDDSDITPEQKEAAAKLFEQLKEKYGIDAGKVYGHGAINSHKMRNEGETIANFLKERYGSTKTASVE